jgi:hypothetical protein
MNICHVPSLSALSAYSTPHALFYKNFLTELQIYSKLDGFRVHEFLGLKSSPRIAIQYKSLFSVLLSELYTLVQQLQQAYPEDSEDQ